MNTHCKAKVDYFQCRSKHTNRYVTTILQLSTQYKEQCLLRGTSESNY